MNKFFLFNLFIILTNITCGQIIKGRVLDKNSNHIIDFAQIYFGGTTIGTLTDKNGYFELDISKNISMNLTISALGYYSVNIDELSTDKTYIIYLTPKMFDLDEVIISAKGKSKQHKKNIALFRKEFLGESVNAYKCNILNENDLSFSYNADKDTLKAFALKPLIIDNKGLGYKITLYLDKFEFCKRNNEVFLEGSIFFNEKPERNKSQKQRFDRARKKAYLGSRMHFIRALWENNLKSEGFVVKDSTSFEADYYRYVFITDTASLANKKYLEYPGTLFVNYPNVTSGYFTFTKELAWIQKDGYCDDGIIWHGKMSKPRIADALPFDYKINSADAQKQLNSLVVKNALKESSKLPQKTNEQDLKDLAIEEFEKLNPSLPQEKIYLHTDRTEYMQGDTIWFKAYSWFGFDQMPDPDSKILYVELVSQKGEIQQSRKLLIQKGSSAGDFTLEKSTRPGKYYLRAYTRWMQNENAGNPYYQPIIINRLNNNFHVECHPKIVKQYEGDSLMVSLRFFELDQTGNMANNLKHKANYSLNIGKTLINKGESLVLNSTNQILQFRLPKIGETDSVAILNLSVKDESITFERQLRIPLKEQLDLQFFPEGGNLVNGLKSKVGFKAIGTDGLAREVKGFIKEKSGDVATRFESSHKGMGAFLFTPEANKDYTAHVEYNNCMFTFSLPKAKANGYVMTSDFSGTDKNIPLILKCSPTKANSEIYVIGSAYGKVYFSSIVRMEGCMGRVGIPVEHFPEGVIRLTILNNDFKPECERLVFINKVRRFNIEIEPDSSVYAPRSKVTLLIKTVYPDGEAISTDLSVAVVDKRITTKSRNNAGISIYKLLESELKGNVEDADSYFNDDGSTNSGALDLLLLTQGYRKFAEAVPDPAEIKYLPEKSIEIAGNVAIRGNSSYNYSQVGLTFFCPTEKGYFDLTNADSLGNFAFQVPLIYGKPLSLLKASLNKGKSYRGNIPKGKMFKGDISIKEDSIPKFMIPIVSDANILTPAYEYIKRLQTIMRTENSKKTNEDQWHLSLPEVTITAKDKRWYERFEENAKKIADLDSLDPTGKKYKNLNDLLVKEFGGKLVRTGGAGNKKPPEIAILPSSGGPGIMNWPIYIIDGNVYWNQSQSDEMENPLLWSLYFMNVSELKRVMVIPPSDISIHYAGNLKGKTFQSLVVIETYSRNWYRGDPNGLKTFILDGLDTPRTFYSPVYEGHLKNSSVYDGRATLYWNPNVTTDSKGEAKVYFYNSDQNGEMEVTVNGFETENGNTGQKYIRISSNN